MFCFVLLYFVFIGGGCWCWVFFVVLFWFWFPFFFLLNNNQSIWPRKMKLTITFPTTYMYALIIEVFFVWADTKSLARCWCMHFSCRSFLCLLGYKLEFQLFFFFLILLVVLMHFWRVLRFSGFAILFPDIFVQVVLAGRGKCKWKGSLHETI